MVKLSDFADYTWVAERMNDYNVKPVVLTSKKDINQYRQEEQARARESAQFISTDFDLIGFPFMRDLSRKDRKDFTSEEDLLLWLMGKYSPPNIFQYLKEKVEGLITPHTPLPEWLNSRGIDVNERRDVKVQLLVTQLEPTLIPNTVQKAYELGVDVRKYNKKGDKQPRGCIIDGEGENPRVYHIFKDFRPGEVKIGEIIPGFPQQDLEGRIWWGLASNDGPYVNFYSQPYKREFNQLPKYEEVLEERAGIEIIRSRMERLQTIISHFKIL